jgi:hypothetical protein
MSTADIRTLLFKAAKEFKTEDAELLIEINDAIEIADLEANKARITAENMNLAIALLTAHNLSLENWQGLAKPLKVASEKIGDEQVTYVTGNSSGDSGDYSRTDYGIRYFALLRTKKKSFKGRVL